ncbi:N6-adenosine-methyltransferase MT-A70-like protein isoform X2 [Stomoxys calcitrans]|uniref:N6-adenosine-methyltransferase MT-A70-like protein isoform X2 n=1 Tax=Stomoxys calcitrans TaxID=35570 RepID=UPI0027E28C3C|nr:N6-adenosine-methyltransferase MT-A70-like protein isoform X2 [Stomoxys calcitrans]
MIYLIWKPGVVRTMTDAWDDIKALKNKRNNLREKLEKRKKERHGILTSTGSPSTKQEDANEEEIDGNAALVRKGESETDTAVEQALMEILSSQSLVLPVISTQLLEKVSTTTKTAISKDSVNYVLNKLAKQGAICIKRVTIGGEVGCEVISVETKVLLDLYKAFINDNYDLTEEIKRKYKILFEEEGLLEDSISNDKPEDNDENADRKDSAANADSDDIMSLLSMPSTREKQSKQVGEEILELLTKPTAKERSVAEKFKSHGGAQVMEFCPHGTKVECMKAQQATAELEAKKRREQKLQKQKLKLVKQKQPVECNNSQNVEGSEESASKRLKLNEAGEAVEIDDNEVKATDSGAEDGEIITEVTKDEADEDATEDDTNDDSCSETSKCTKLHFKKIIQSHTDESLGDCSFLNTCFHMATCKYVHYEVDTLPNINTNKPVDVKTNRCIKRSVDPNVTLYPPQWIQCDLRYLDMTVLGKFAVVMADPPWDIHMELPYGTMSDDEMRQLGVPALQDDGLIFLWVTGRAMELGRECLMLWGYERVDELIWVKTNQLQRIIRTGRTGHWLNHGKEHCLVGMKGNPKNLNRGLDGDVIVAEVRATSHKPDEIYGIIERLSPGSRKIELFGRPHNVQPNWITLGNQLDGIRLVDPELITQFQKRYPDGNCMAPATTTTTVVKK